MKKFSKNKKLTQEPNNNEYDKETKIVNDVIYNGDRLRSTFLPEALGRPAGSFPEQRLVIEPTSR